MPTFIQKASPKVVIRIRTKEDDSASPEDLRKMDLEKQLYHALTDHLPKAEIRLNFDGKLLEVYVTCESFKGMNRVKSQQRLFAVLEPWILNQQVHAVKFHINTT